MNSCGSRRNQSAVLAMIGSRYSNKPNLIRTTGNHNRKYQVLILPGNMRPSCGNCCSSLYGNDLRFFVALLQFPLWKALAGTGTVRVQVYSSYIAQKKIYNWHTDKAIRNFRWQLTSKVCVRAFNLLCGSATVYYICYIFSPYPFLLPDSNNDSVHFSVSKRLRHALLPIFTKTLYHCLPGNFFDDH